MAINMKEFINGETSVADRSDYILDTVTQISELSKEITSAWDMMMTGASLRAMLRMELTIVRFVDALGEKEVSSKKHLKKLAVFSSRLDVLMNLELCSTNYIKRILTPCKALAEEFDHWSKLSVINQVKPLEQLDIREEIDEVMEELTRSSAVLAA